MDLCCSSAYSCTAAIVTNHPAQLPEQATLPSDKAPAVHASEGIDCLLSPHLFIPLVQALVCCRLQTAQRSGLQVALLGALASCLYSNPSVALASMQQRLLPVFTAWSQARLLHLLQLFTGLPASAST